MSAESEVRRLRDEVGKLRAKIGHESDTVAKKRKKATDARQAASRSKSSSTIASKNREAESADREANAAERRRADLEKKLADTEKKLHTAQTRMEKEKDTRNQRALDTLRRQTGQATRQFTSGLLRAAAVPPSALANRAGLSKPAPAYDVFLSHASEDKDEIARPLKDALEARELTVWFDEIKLKVGQSIRQEIEKGIGNARFGVVILSPAFFAKQWTEAELDALFSRKMSTGEDMILPIWHKVTKDEVMAQSPLLAGIMALNTAVSTLDEIADSLAEAVRA